MYLIGAMAQCETLKEFGKILFHITVLCTTTYEKHAEFWHFARDQWTNIMC